MNTMTDMLDRNSTADAGHSPEAPCLVTIVIAVFNRLQYLGEAIASALAQTHPHVQIIVVDDGSINDPWPVVSRFGDRIEFHRKPNGGLASARNAGIGLARGEYILFLDDDDYLEPEAVEAILSALKNNPETVWSAGRFVYDTGAGPKIPGRASLEFESGDIYARMIFECLISCPSAVLVRTKVIRAAGLFDESFRLSEDYDMWLALARDHSIAASPVVVTNYRVHPNQVSAPSGPGTMMPTCVCWRSIAPGHGPALNRCLRRRSAMSISSMEIASTSTVIPGKRTSAGGAHLRAMTAACCSSSWPVHQELPAATDPQFTSDPRRRSTGGPRSSHATQVAIRWRIVYQREEGMQVLRACLGIHKINEKRYETLRFPTTERKEAYRCPTRNGQNISRI